MKAYSIDLREKIVKTYLQGDTSVRKVAHRFGVAKSFVQKLLLMNKNQGHVKPNLKNIGNKGKLDGCESQLAAMVEQNPDATLSEYCEYWGTTYSNWLSISTMCRALQKQKLTLKKKTLRSSQARTDRVQVLRSEYWDQIRQVDPKNLIFLDEMGVLLGLTRSEARSPVNTRVYDFKPFYRGAKVTVIGAISCNRVLALMTLNDSMDGKAFRVFVEKLLVPQLWVGAVVGEHPTFADIPYFHLL